MKKINLCVAIIFFLFSSFSFSSTLNCAAEFNNNTYVGRFTDIIDKNGWDSTTYILQLSDGTKGCVQINYKNNKVRYKIVHNAFLLGSEVHVSTDSAHNITGIGYRNDE